MPEVPENPPSPRTPLGFDSVRYRPLSIDAAGNLQVVIVGGRVGMYRDYIHVQDRKAMGADGGGFTLGAWRTRDINLELDDTGAICTIAANQITLQAGVYRCLITCPAIRAHHHQARLRNITAGLTMVLGTNEYTISTDTISTRSVVMGRFTLAVASVLEVQHQCTATQAGNGFGTSCGFGFEIYTDAEFWREW